MFDALVIGGGAAGMQCALVLGSAKNTVYGSGKKTGIIMHQKASHLQSALLNNVLGIAPGTTGMDILEQGKQHLAAKYPHVVQIEKEKVIAVSGEAGNFIVKTNKAEYVAKIVVVALGYTDLFNIEGLNEYLIPHRLSPPSKNRKQLQNTDHLVKEGLYVAGTLAGWRSQFAIAAGSGAQVATDILTFWNGGKHTKVHDKI
ncbi:FAD-dependent oxidoreductase [Sinomicrobium weinanense]|uniref:NAD(P)/FAD-dependent oxidoreductase n=1 Tax=Sinomicrobium weinanense TaxID=2842200 RepID=A0A926JP73_9FLAO|nr:FAD-dependent oxidoreductase [Sinomicrobium weinanense]MBC9794851.1 NAD(P)/FAD-dependent oxidoreductase [Sinomicrobium weinanense]MBU3125622.1 FAD-dependent oxidoreductase [Sinomicrobium weinanense]